MVKLFVCILFETFSHKLSYDVYFFKEIALPQNLFVVKIAILKLMHTNKEPYIYKVFNQKNVIDRHLKMLIVPKPHLNMCQKAFLEKSDLHKGRHP